MTALVGVLPDDIPQCWPVIAPRVAEACAAAEGDHTPQDYFDHCRASRMQLWACVRDGALAGVLITSISGTLCRLELAQADSLDYALSELDTVIGWAKGLGCNEIDFHGRKGWTKPFLAAGFKTQTVHMSRSI